MDPRRVFELLEAALEVPADARLAALERLCGGDAALRQRLETLLALETQADDYLNESAITDPAELEDGSRLGPYRILELINRGGMGAVYRATREIDFEKPVAVKVIRRGLPESILTRRFYIERQILARLEHSGIARLLDGGTTDAGHPYLVMEYVDGVPLADYCHGFGVHQRLELFLQVLEAVAYAHRHLVVHRDLKPDNILVTADGTVKLLDFGIAKLLDPDIGLATDLTLPKERPMTLRYASPEQVRREPITTASDIYSLGVILHQLLTGTSPYQVTGDSWSEMVQAVCEGEPGRPSTQVPAGASRKKLVGDLDAIVLEALCKEPRQRYASVERFADDIRRHLEERPVRARHGTWSYRFGKLVRRRPAATAALAVILAFSVASTLLWQRADRERLEAVREQNRAQRVSDFLTDLFRSAGMDAAKGTSLEARAILDPARARLAAGGEDGPALEADLAATLARVYRGLGLRREAITLLERSVDIRRRLHPTGHPELAAALEELTRTRDSSPSTHGSAGVGRPQAR